MINATPTLPTASALPPKDPTLAARPAPEMSPKKKSNWKVILGSLVLLLVIAGGAVGFYLTQQAGIGDTRQQAAGSCTNGNSYCGSGSGVCLSGYTPATDSACPNGIRCNCATPVNTCSSGGICVTTSSCANENRAPVNGECASSGQRCCSVTVATCLGTCRAVSSCTEAGLTQSSGSCNSNQVCCGGPIPATPTCYDKNQGCIQIQSLDCNQGVGGGKYTTLAACQQTECDPSQVINHTCPTGQEAYCSNGAVACRTVTEVYGPITLQGCNQNCYSRTSCTCPAGCAQSLVFLSQTCGGNTTPALTSCTATCNSQAGCSCPSTCNQSVAMNGLTCGGVKTATPTPGTGGTGLMCPNSPTTPAKKWIKFTCPNGCTQTTENGVTAWRCYENRQDSTTELNLAPGECGQVDVLSGTTDDTYCGYKPSNYTCDQSQCQRQPSPSPTTPPQSSCASLEVLDPVSLAPVAKSAVVAGQEYRYRCVPGAGVPADYYFFTARSNTTGPLNLIYQGTSDLTFPIMTTDYLHVQCNPCVGTTCASAQNVNSSCNFEYTKTVTPGPQCLALWMASVDNPTVSLTNPKVGDRIFLGCGQVQGAARYIFKVTEPDGNVTNLGPLDVTAAPTTSEAYSITKQGRHYAQCQICTGQADSTCFPYETLPTQGQN